MPPKPPKNKRNRNMLIGAAAVGLLLLLYLRSRSATTGNATSPTDVQNAASQAAQQQAQQDAQLYGSNTPSTFADNGANAAALGDSVTGGLQGINDALIQQSGAFATLASTLAPPAAAAAAPAPAPVAITINGTGQPAGGVAPVASVSQPPSVASRDAAFLAPGAHAPNYLLVPPKGAPQNARWAGSTRPGAGWVGIGGGWWKPVKK